MIIHTKKNFIRVSKILEGRWEVSPSLSSPETAIAIGTCKASKADFQLISFASPVAFVELSDAVMFSKYFIGKTCSVQLHFIADWDFIFIIRVCTFNLIPLSTLESFIIWPFQSWNGRNLERGFFYSSSDNILCISDMCFFCLKCLKSKCIVCFSFFEEDAYSSSYSSSCCSDGFVFLEFSTSFFSAIVSTFLFSDWKAKVSSTFPLDEKEEPCSSYISSYSTELQQDFSLEPLPADKGTSL